MPEDNSTWETASSPDPVAPATEPVVETVAETPPAEAPTLETAPQLEAEPAVRESESPAVQPKEEAKDEDIQEGDTPEIQALPSGSSSRAWARRQFHDAAPIRDYLDFSKPIETFGSELFKRSASRYTELVDDIATQHADYLSQKLFGLNVDEAKTRLQTPPAPANVSTPTTTTLSPIGDKSLPLTEQELENLSLEEVSERLTQFATAKEQEKQALAKQYEDLKKQLDAVSGEITTQKQQGFKAEIQENQNKLLNNVMSVVDEGIRNSGLEVQPTDPPKIANLKRAAARLLDRQNVLANFDAVPENVKLVGYVTEAMNRREYQNAFREEDNLKVRARAAFESVKTSPEVKEILGEIEAYANQSKGNSRAANPIPPAPGSSLGTVIKPPTTWDEAVNPTAA